MGMFIKFKCWGCDELVCTCTKVERSDKYDAQMSKKTITKPLLKVHDIAVSEGKDWLVLEIKEGYAIVRERTNVMEPQEKRLLEPYRRLTYSKLTKKRKK